MWTITNPDFCKINIKISDGLKLFNVVVKGINKACKFSMLIENVWLFKLQYEGTTKKFNWGQQVTNMKEGKIKYNLIVQRSDLTLKYFCFDDICI